MTSSNQCFCRVPSGKLCHTPGRNEPTFQRIIPPPSRFAQPMCCLIPEHSNLHNPHCDVTGHEEQRYDTE